MSTPDAKLAAVHLMYGDPEISACNNTIQTRFVLDVEDVTCVDCLRNIKNGLPTPKTQAELNAEFDAIYEESRS